VLNRYSHIPGTQPHEYESHIPPGEPCSKQEHVPIQGYCMHTTGSIGIEYRRLCFPPHIQHVGCKYLGCACEPYYRWGAACGSGRTSVGLYTILQLPMLYGMYCNTGWSGGNTVLRNSVGNEGWWWCDRTKGLFANDSIGSCTKASS